MSEQAEQTPEEGSGELMDAPNQQAVRPDSSAPWDEGTGGIEQEGVTPPETPSEATGAALPASQEELDTMSKDDLLALAKARGLSPANNAMTKEQLREVIDAG